MTEFAYTILFVKDLEKAKEFYTQYFDQAITVDMGQLIGFASGLALWQEDDMAAKADFPSDGPLMKNRGGMEIEFHTEDIQALHDALVEAGVEMIHGVRMHPWGQKVFRCYDFDGHCIEVDEYLRVTAQRLQAQGMMPSQIGTQFGMPQQAVDAMLTE